MTKAKYFLVENGTRKTLGVFTSFAQAALYRAANGLFLKATIWGFDPKSIQKAAK